MKNSENKQSHAEIHSSRMNNTPVLLSLTIIVFLLFGSLAFVAQYGNVTDENNKLEKQNFQLQQDLKHQQQEYNQLESLTFQYLIVENQSCPSNQSLHQCLQDKINQLDVKTGPECSTIFDNVCPVWCAAGSDYDCCVNSGMDWIQGRGCYSKKETPPLPSSPSATPIPIESINPVAL